MTKFIEKKEGNSFLLYVKIKPNSKKQEIILDEDRLLIRVRSKAIHNKANKELINLLKKKVGIHSDHLTIISGLKSSNKVIKIEFNEDFDEKKMLNLLI